MTLFLKVIVNSVTNTFDATVEHKNRFNLWNYYILYYKSNMFMFVQIRSYLVRFVKTNSV